MNRESGNTGTDLEEWLDESSNGEAEGVQVEPGMVVVSESEDALGQVDSILVNEGSEEGHLIVLQREPDGRLVLLPAVTLTGAMEGGLVVGVGPEEVAELPEFREDQEPTIGDVRRAYEVVGASADFLD